MIFKDYHVHSKFSTDSKESLENIIEKGKELGLKEIAITDHMDLKTNNGGKFIFDVEEYFKVLTELKEKHKKEIDIKIGMEFGIQRGLEVELKKLAKNSFDFILMSTHSIDGVLVDRSEFWEGKSKEEVHKEYFLNLLDCVIRNNDFSVVGHLDFISRYGGKKRGKVDHEKYVDIIDEILKVLIEKGKGIEVNTSGIRYLEERFYPANSVLKRYKEFGGEIITVGSDAHRAEDICKNFKDVKERLEIIGFEYLASFDDQKVIFEKLE